MGTGIFDITKLSAAMIGSNNQFGQRTSWLLCANKMMEKDNGVFVEERWSQNYENRNLFKASC
ncbi:hypothetical protein [Treponema sp.]|uniref:hypothetical protein n=1 Tax=Treponema sp. TaxID=166 RepID=UPI003890C2A8